MAVTATASATSSTTLATVTTSFIIENTDANRLHVLLDDGTATTTTNYSFSLAQYENARVDGYFGKVKGIWAADGAGHSLITEISAP